MPARRLRLGMVGGGRGAFIGAVHRMSARLDDQYELVAGALSSDPRAGETLRGRSAIAPGAPMRTFAQWRRPRPRVRTESTWSRL